ncbi:MAG: hypothetical protein IJS83_02690 [Acholeplasmatales bacterium]|nr:hypothetical protein [Acholeplasmatales bacterium]
MKEVPLFLINGFLESGKTSLIKEIVENNTEYQNDTTVIIACEQGEIEYDEEWCKKYGVHVEYIESQDEFTENYMKNLDKRYMADRYVIEFNSFFDIDKQDFPRYMVIYQQITLIDASTFKVMFNNMKNVFSTMIKYSSLVVFNRCDGVTELGQFRRQIRGMNQQAQIAFEQANGSLTTMLEEDLPYDLSKSEIAFEEDVYPVWYTEVFDNYEKYFNKTFKFKTFVRDITDETIVIGRNVMVCCANDVQFLGYELKNDCNAKVKVGDCIYLECTVSREFSKLANEEVVMLHAKNITILKPEKEKVIGM